MPAIRHNIYLTKNHSIISEKDTSGNVFILNEHTKSFNVDWMKRNIVKNDGVYIFQDNESKLSKDLIPLLEKKNYFISTIDCKQPSLSLHLNPFDLVHDTSTIHFLFSNFLFELWDNADPDIMAMSHLIDAFASAIYYLFDGDRTKRSMKTLVNMVKSINAQCVKNGVSVPMYEAIFVDNPDPNWIPKKYFSQFVSVAKDRKQEIANKVLQFFNLFSEDAINMMSKTDEDISASLLFKTAFIINATPDTEDISKVIGTLLISLIENSEQISPVMYVVENLDANHLMIGLPRWIQNSPKNNIDFILFNDNIGMFTKTLQAEQFMNKLKATVNAAMLIHKNKYAEKQQRKLSKEELQIYHNTEYVTTLIMPGQSKIEDEVF